MMIYLAWLKESDIVEPVILGVFYLSGVNSVSNGIDIIEERKETSLASLKQSCNDLYVDSKGTDWGLHKQLWR
jgi:hypothetical protein